MRLIKSIIVSILLVAPALSLGMEMDEAEKVDLEELLKSDLLMACVFYDINKSNRDTCNSPLVDVICKQGKNSLDDAISSLMNSSSIESLVSEDKNREEIFSTLRSEANESFESCVNPNAKLEAEWKKQLAEVDVEKLNRDYWRSVFRTTSQLAIQGTQSYMTSKSVKGVIFKYITLGSCEHAASAATSIITNKAFDPNQDQCKAETYSFKKGHLRSCISSVKSLCRAGIGLIDVSKWPLMASENDYVNYLEDVASAGISYACSKSVVAMPLCGLISESMSQIRKAIDTGNNDWAECTGLSSLGRCLGQRIAAGGNILTGREGWVNNQKVSTPVKNYRTGESSIQCCQCERALYEDHWFGDKKFYSENTIGVIQNGSFKTSNCNYPGGQSQGKKIFQASYIRNGYNVYAKYSNCKKVVVMGNTCSYERAGKLRYYDRAYARPVGLEFKPNKRYFQ